MYPEMDIVAEFWLFVRKRAADVRLDLEGPEGSGTLNAIEYRRNTVAYWLTDEEQREGFEDWELGPKVYETVQGALLAFLVNEVALENFPYDYETWLRAVALVLGDAQRDQGRLTVIVQATPDGGSEHHMTVSKTEWDCVNRDSFRFVKEHYSGRESAPSGSRSE